MAFKRYFLVMIWMAFSVLSLSAKKEWNADNVPIPFLQDSTTMLTSFLGIPVFIDTSLMISAFVISCIFCLFYLFILNRCAKIQVFYDITK